MSVTNKSKMKVVRKNQSVNREGQEELVKFEYLGVQIELWSKA